jgi:hypothetical protein
MLGRVIPVRVAGRSKTRTLAVLHHCDGELLLNSFDGAAGIFIGVSNIAQKCIELQSLSSPSELQSDRKIAYKGVA